MQMVRPTFGTGRARVIQIAYYCDVTSDSGLVIPLGVMMNIHFGTIHGLGLRARVNLTDSELAAVGGLMKDSLRHPFKLLEGEFRRVWKSPSPQDAFTDLPAQRMGALRFEMESPRAKQLRMPRPIAASDVGKSKVVDGWMLDQLKAGCIAGYLGLLERHWMGDAMPAGDNLKDKLAA